MFSRGLKNVHPITIDVHGKMNYIPSNDWEFEVFVLKAHTEFHKESAYHLD